jgi:hypothetical protein
LTWRLTSSRMSYTRARFCLAPSVAVSGWTCQGYPTPVVLSTGTASQCHTASAAIVAVLPVRAPGATSTAG